MYCIGGSSSYSFWLSATNDEEDVEVDAVDDNVDVNDPGNSDNDDEDKDGEGQGTRATCKEAASGTGQVSRMTAASERPARASSARSQSASWVVEAIWL